MYDFDGMMYGTDRMMYAIRGVMYGLTKPAKCDFGLLGCVDGLSQG